MVPIIGRLLFGGQSVPLGCRFRGTNEEIEGPCPPWYTLVPALSQCLDGISTSISEYVYIHKMLLILNDTIVAFPLTQSLLRCITRYSFHFLCLLFTLILMSFNVCIYTHSEQYLGMLIRTPY